jgi:hypothetical protein
MEFKKGDILEFKGVPTYAAKKGAKAICVGNNADIQNEVESFRRFEESWVGKTAAVNRATTMREIFKALEDTAIEEDDNFIIELFTTEQ